MRSKDAHKQLARTSLNECTVGKIILYKILHNVYSKHYLFDTFDLHTVGEQKLNTGKWLPWQLW